MHTYHSLTDDEPYRLFTPNPKPPLLLTTAPPVEFRSPVTTSRFSKPLFEGQDRESLSNLCTGYKDFTEMSEISFWPPQIERTLAPQRSVLHSFAAFRQHTRQRLSITHHAFIPGPYRVYTLKTLNSKP